MATTLQIANSAIIKLGGAEVSTIASAGTSKEQKLLYAQLPRLFRSLLMSHTWTFAKTFSEPSDSASTLTPTWTYYFARPSDAGRILAVTTLDDIEIPYEIVGSNIHTNEEEIRIRYVDIPTDAEVRTDATTWPDDFGECLANLIAAELAVSLTQNQSLRDTYLAAFQFALSQARFNGAVEDYPMQSTSPDWLEVRDSGIGLDIDPSRRGLAGY